MVTAKTYHMRQCWCYVTFMWKVNFEEKNGSSIEKFPSLVLQRLQHLIIQFPLYLTIRLFALDLYEAIVDSAFGLINYHLIEISSS